VSFVSPYVAGTSETTRPVEAGPDFRAKGSGVRLRIRYVNQERLSVRSGDLLLNPVHWYVRNSHRLPCVSMVLLPVASVQLLRNTDSLFLHVDLAP
jgi:hypothetical protein